MPHRDGNSCRDAKKYYSLIWEKKCEKNALSFDDGERLVLELLADKDESGNIVQSEAAKRIADYYDIIMIDEYQDSNNKQDMIFKLISKDYHFSEEGNPLYGSNAFVVGDVKAVDIQIPSCQSSEFYFYNEEFGSVYR